MTREMVDGETPAIFANSFDVMAPYPQREYSILSTRVHDTDEEKSSPLDH